MFPYEMMQCSSIKDFCFLYLKYIVVVLLFYGDTSRLNELAVTLDKNLCTIFKVSIKVLSGLLHNMYLLRLHLRGNTLQNIV